MVNFLNGTVAFLMFANAAGVAGQETAPVKKPVVRKSKAKKPPAEPGEVKASDKPVKGKYPPLEQRLAAYKEQLEEKKVAREDSRPYLIELIEITGISEAGEGFNAFVRAEDGKTLILRAGMNFYNGVVEAIQADRIVFRMNGTKKTVEKKYGQAIDAKADETPQ